MDYDLVNWDGPSPSWATDGSAAFDFPVSCDTNIGPGKLARVQTNVIVKVPEGSVLLVSLRSSVPKRHTLLMPHGVGVIDPDYCGPQDEVLVQVWNFGYETAFLVRGERIAQGLLLPAHRPTLVQTTLTGESRGGFGSTG